jgi:hypothetical protein
MNDDIKKLEGSFSVNGKETPITHKPIDHVDSSKWHTLPTHVLLDHRTTLQNRLHTVYSLPNGQSLAQQLKMGIAQLESIISKRKDDTITLI